MSPHRDHPAPATRNARAQRSRVGPGRSRWISQGSVVKPRQDQSSTPPGSVIDPARISHRPRQDQSSLSTQSKVLVTAFFHFLYSLALVTSSICGTQRLDSAQFVRMSSSDFQNPTANPAA